MNINLNGMFIMLMFFGAFIVAILWGAWEFIDWMLIDDAIRVSEPLVPEIELIINDNVVDTVYVYQLP